MLTKSQKKAIKDAYKSLFWFDKQYDRLDDGPLFAINDMTDLLRRIHIAALQKQLDRIALIPGAHDLAHRLADEVEDYYSAFA